MSTEHPLEAANPIPDVDVDRLLAEVREGARRRRVEQALAGLSEGQLGVAALRLREVPLLNARWDLRSHRPGVGPVITAVKRVLRLGLRWVIDPLVRDQNAFNREALELTDRMAAAIDALVGRTELLERRIRALESVDIGIRLTQLEAATSAAPADPGLVPLPAQERWLSPTRRAQLTSVLTSLMAELGLSGARLAAPGAAPGGWVEAALVQAGVELVQADAGPSAVAIVEPGEPDLRRLPELVASAALVLPRGGTLILVVPNPESLAALPESIAEGLPPHPLALADLFRRCGLEPEIRDATPWDHLERAAELPPFPLPGEAAEAWAEAVQSRFQALNRRLFASSDLLVLGRRAD